MPLPDVSALRLLGLIAALVLGVVAIIVLRRERSDSFVPIAALFTAALLFIVSIFPQMATILNEIVAIGDFQGSRLITLAIAAIAVLWISFIFYSARVQSLGRQLDRFVRKTTIDKFVAEDRIDCAGAVLCTVPALNEAENLKALLPRFREIAAGHPVKVLIVDDGSEDETADVVRQMGHSVISLPVNRGGGSALRVGFDVAIQSGAEIVVTIDADGQNDPEAVEDLVKPIIEGDADIVIGSRILGDHEITHWWRHFGVVLFSNLINLLMGTRITDCSSGYRAIRTASLTGLRLFQDQYHTSEFLILAAKKGYRISEVPIVFRRRLSGKSKKGNEFLYGFRFCYVLLTTWLRSH